MAIPCVRRRLDFAQIVRDARDAAQTAFVVEHLHHFRCGDAFALDEKAHDGGIEVAAARRHHQAFERRQAHRGIDRHSIANRGR
jgi:hypothetical protein